MMPTFLFFVHFFNIKSTYNHEYINNHEYLLSLKLNSNTDYYMIMMHRFCWIKTFVLWAVTFLGPGRINHNAP